MKAPFDFVIEPKGNRYNNTTKVGDKELILNTEVYNHEFVNREAIVKSVPTAFKSKIQQGDTIITHHNVFRRWHNQYGDEKNSKSFFYIKISALLLLSKYFRLKNFYYFFLDL